MAVLPSEGAKELLSAHTATSGWQVEIGMMPNKPDRVIAIYDRPGAPPNPKWLLDYPSLAILVRAEISAFREARDEAQAIYDLLLGISSQDVLGDRWVSVTSPGSIASVARDQNDRPTFSVNFELIIEPATNANTQRQAL